MDKAEYKIKLEQINAYAESGDFRGAAQTADTIDWRRVKSARTLCMISEIYEANKRYEDGMEILRYAYRRAPQSKTVLYRLAETSLRAGNLPDAEKYYAEFEQIAPHDTSHYVLKYKLLRAKKAPLDEQIAVLKEYKEREYTEKWAYELAKLYKKNGQKQRCIEECDDMILWFAEGRYVTRAMELKMQLVPLSESQKAKYESRLAAAKEAAEREALLSEEPESVPEAVEEEAAAEEETTETAGDEEQDAEEVPSSVSAAEMIEKMNAAADASLQGARSQNRMPHVTPAARQSISGRNKGGNDMQDQLASSIRAVFSGLRAQSEEKEWEAPVKEEPKRDLRQTEEPVVSLVDEEDLDLAKIFAETENSIARTVKAATTDEVTEDAEKSAPVKKEEAAAPQEEQKADEAAVATEPSAVSDAVTDEISPAAPESTDQDAEDDVAVSFVQKDGVIEAISSGEMTETADSMENTVPAEDTALAEDKAADKPEDEQKAVNVQEDDLTGRETDESLGITREFNFREELERESRRRSGTSGRAKTAARTYDSGKWIPNPEEAAVKIVAEANREQAATAPDTVSEQTSSAGTAVDFSGWLFTDVTEIPTKNPKTVTEMSQDRTKETKAPAEDAPKPDISARPVRSSIIDHLLDEPDMIDRMDVTPRSLDDTEKKLFSYFASIPGIGEQVSVAIADIHNNSGDRTSKAGNVLIVGRRGCGKTKLADSLVLAVCKDLNITAAKTAKIIASDFNQKDAAAIVKKMAGGFLIIEGAGELAADTVDKLNRAMEFRTDDMVVILEDEKQDMKDMLDKYPEFAAKFTSRITIPVFTNDELVTFGKTYAQENGYSFDEMATLALYTMIGENQKNTEPVTVSMVREMIDKAIAKSKSKKFPLFGKSQVGADGNIILREKDFTF